MNAENSNYFEELVELAKACGVENQVKFIRSPSLSFVCNDSQNFQFSGDHAKVYLMETARLVIYTPDHEHFGIVPLEAMYLSTPVLAGFIFLIWFSLNFLSQQRRSTGDGHPREDWLSSSIRSRIVCLFNGNGHGRSGIWRGVGRCRFA